VGLTRAQARAAGTDVVEFAELVQDFVRELVPGADIVTTVQFPAAGPASATALPAAGAPPAHTSPAGGSTRSPRRSQPALAVVGDGSARASRTVPPRARGTGEAPASDARPSPVARTADARTADDGLRGPRDAGVSAVGGAGRRRAE
jgi:hypothetical protein